MSKVLDVLAYAILVAAILVVVLAGGVLSMMMIVEHPWVSLRLTCLLLFCLVTYWAAFRIWRDKL